MPKFAVSLAQLVRQTAVVIVEAESESELQENLSDVYSEEGDEANWGLDPTWGAEEGTHCIISRLKAPGEPSRFKWTVEFEVDEVWVADGFNLDDERAQEMLLVDLGYARPHEVSAKVISAPDPKSIKKAQGYD